MTFWNRKKKNKLYDPLENLKAGYHEELFYNLDSGLSSKQWKFEKYRSLQSYHSDHLHISPYEALDAQKEIKLLASQRRQIIEELKAYAWDKSKDIKPVMGDVDWLDMRVNEYAQMGRSRL